MTEPQSQSDKFKALAEEVGADQDEARWDERLKKIAAHKLPSKQEQPE